MKRLLTSSRFFCSLNPRSLMLDQFVLTTVESWIFRPIKLSSNAAVPINPKNTISRVLTLELTFSISFIILNHLSFSFLKYVRASTTSHQIGTIMNEKKNIHKRRASNQFTWYFSLLLFSPFFYAESNRDKELILFVASVVIVLGKNISIWPLSFTVKFFCVVLLSSLLVFC